MKGNFGILAEILAIVVTSMLFASTAGADSDEEWKMVLAFPMIWAPSIEGHVEVDGRRTDIDVGFSDIFDNLSMGLIGEFYASKGNWGTALRLDYLFMELDNELTSGITRTTIESEIDVGLADFLLSYRVHPDLKLVTGARMLYSKIGLNIKSRIGDTTIIDRNVSLTDDTQWDLLLGINYIHRFDNRWALMLNADYGVGGNNDRNIGIDLRGWYSYNERHSLWFGYKALHLYTELEEDGVKAEMELTQHGPTLGYAYTF